MNSYEKYKLDFYNNQKSRIKKYSDDEIKQLCLSFKVNEYFSSKEQICGNTLYHLFIKEQRLRKLKNINYQQ